MRISGVYVQTACSYRGPNDDIVNNNKKIFNVLLLNSCNIKIHPNKPF